MTGLIATVTAGSVSFGTVKFPETVRRLRAGRACRDSRVF
jgi:hypothetical protein